MIGNLIDYKEMFVEDPEVEENIDQVKSNILTIYNFQLPIEYNNHSKITDIVKQDVEMEKMIKYIYNFNNSSHEHNLLDSKFSSIYSTSKTFLKDNQKFIKHFKYLEGNMHPFIDEYIDFKSEQNFLSKYQYVQFKRFYYLNSVTTFLQMLALYNILSPLLSLLSPLLGVIVPYFVLYWKGIRLSLTDYWKVVKNIIYRNGIINGLLNFHKNTINQNAYTVVTIFFFGMSVYNNINSCKQFISNTEYLIDLLDKTSIFLQRGKQMICHIYKQTQHLKTFKAFNENMMKYLDNIKAMNHTLDTIHNENDKMMKYGKLGWIMKCNFELFNNDMFHDTIMYLIYLNNYNENMYNINNCYKQGFINKCKFVKNKKVKMSNSYYVSHMRDQPIKNNISLKKNIIITGPNASGKTTMIKSSILNLFFSQSIGYGCYENCSTGIYDYFHSYLNIPDTSNRDSLFQAEARRCKDILAFISKKKDKRHFCIFDEIYSGTNPDDAVLCASIYLEKMNSHKDKVDYVLTTHYIDICKKFDDSKFLMNMKMTSHKNGDTVEHTYLCQNGISTINGGYSVLINLENE
jgi:hypothetical protein